MPVNGRSSRRADLTKTSAPERENLFTVTVHSAKGGSGKSTLVSNLAVALARKGKSVGVIDLDYAAPGLHIIFGLSKEARFSFEDVLGEKCTLSEAVIDLTKKLNLERGNLVFIPSSLEAKDMVNQQRLGYDVPVLERLIKNMFKEFSLDYLILDTRHGVSLPSLPAIAVSDVVLFVARLDMQDVAAGKAPLQVARALKKRVLLVASMIPRIEESERLRKRLGRMFGLPVASVLPYDPQLQMNQSSGVFILNKQHSDYPSRINSLADVLVELRASKFEASDGVFWNNF